MMSYIFNKINQKVCFTFIFINEVILVKSSFTSDLKKEQLLSHLLDSCYKKHLKYYNFKRISDLPRQLQGIDLIVTHKVSKKEFMIDEKAQLDYINRDLSTFAFELQYQKKALSNKGGCSIPTKKPNFTLLLLPFIVMNPMPILRAKSLGSIAKNSFHF